MRKIQLALKKYFNGRGKIISCVSVYFVASFFTFKIVFEKWEVCIILVFCGLPIFVNKIKKWLLEKKQKAIETEFFLLLSQISMAMSSSMSLENALREAVITGKKEYKTLKNDLEGVYRMLQNNYSPEYVFCYLAKKTGNREIKTFAEIISVGIPAGINIAALMRWLNSAYRMRTDTEGEISRVLNAPKYNNRIILIMPIVCIALFKAIAPTYMLALYVGSGRIIMFFVAFVIVLAWWIGEKISDINC